MAEENKQQKTPQIKGRGFKGYTGNKAKNFKGSFIKIGKSLSKFKILVILALSFAIISTVLNVVAPSVLSVGYHAFYYDGLLRYVDLENCKTLFADAFNGAAFEYAQSETKAKIFIPNVEDVKKHAFWQTGFVFVDLSKCEKFDISSFEENTALKKVVVENLEELVFIENPVLSEVIEKGNLSKSKE